MFGTTIKKVYNTFGPKNKRERYGTEMIKKLQAMNSAFQKNYAYDAYYEFCW